MVHSSDFIRCQICDKGFSGPEPYQEHINSQKHLKRAGIASGDSAQSQQADESLRCDLCDMKFSGSVPYAQHMEGSKHSQQIKRKDLMEDLTANAETESSSLYPNLTEVAPALPQGLTKVSTTTVEVLKCELCGVSLTGPESMKDHLESRGHKRKLELGDWKQVLGQNNLPASAPTLEQNNGDRQEPAMEADAQIQKHKKPIGCFRIFSCVSKKKKKKDKLEKSTV